MEKTINQNGVVEVVTKENKKYYLYKNTFAALAEESNNPLFCTSLANSSFSVDMWRGCKYRCAYCHVQGCLNDYVDGTINYQPVRRTNFSEEEVVKKLIEYSLFNGKSIISINTSSTEPFANKEVSDSTIAVMESFIKFKCYNPFWIVTKGGTITEEQIERMSNLIKKGAKIIVSICWTNNIPEIEPMRHNRFSFVNELDRIGVHVNWYMRPLVQEWNASAENIEYLMKTVSENKYPIKSVVAGGLRWTSGIEYGLVEINHQPLPKLVKDENTKTLSREIIELIRENHKKYLPNIPLFFKSSCSLSYALNIPSSNLVDLFDKDYCDISYCEKNQQEICKKRKVENIDEINKGIEKYGYELVNEKDEWNLKPLRENHSYQDNVLVKRYLQDKMDNI